MWQDAADLGTLLFGIGSIGGLAAFVPYIRRQKRIAVKVDEIHAKVTER